MTRDNRKLSGVSNPKLIKDETGARYGRLTVVKVAGICPNNRMVMWECRCDCGKSTTVLGTSLRNGRTTSCGCYGHECKFGGHGELSLTYWNSLVSNAARRGHTFDLKIEFGWNLFLFQNRRCALTGREIVFCAQNKRFETENTASLDRIDSKVGYVEGNVRWVHKELNRMKGALTDQQFLEFCYEVCSNHERLLRPDNSP